MSLCFAYCLSITGNSAGLALTKLQNNHAKNICELVSRGWLQFLPSAKETMHEHDEELAIYDNAFRNYF